MRGKEKVIFDIKSEKFRYLLRGNNKTSNVVNIDVLNERLNRVRKSNTYTNAKMIALSLFIAGLFILISMKF